MLPNLPANAPPGTRHPAYNDSPLPVGQDRAEISDQSVPVGQVPMNCDFSPNTAPGKAIQIAELGHGSVWIQYRYNHTRGVDQLSFHEKIAKTHNLAINKLPDDFGKLLETEVGLSDIAVRVKNIDDTAQKMFATYLENYEYTQRAGPP